MPGKTSPAERASAAAAAMRQNRQHLDRVEAHQGTHDMLGLMGGAILGGDGTNQHPAAQKVMDDHGHRIPMTPKEQAAVAELEQHHPGSYGLTRRDPGNTGPLLAQFADQTYEIDGDAVKEV